MSGWRERFMIDRPARFLISLLREESCQFTPSSENPLHAHRVERAHPGTIRTVFYSYRRVDISDRRLKSAV